MAICRRQNAVVRVCPRGIRDHERRACAGDKQRPSDRFRSKGRAPTRVHKRTDSGSVEVQGSRYAEKGPDYGENSMLFIVGIVIALVSVVILPGMRVPGGVNGAQLGWMSEQWLTEHRASHSA